MLARTHFIFGVLIGLLTYSVSTLNSWFFVLLVGFSAILPDIDHPNSKINNKLGFSKSIAVISKHRGIFHSIWAPVLLLFGLPHFFDFNFVVPVFLGYLSHILLDSLTKEGINFLHPFLLFQIRGPIKTGNFTEFLLFIVLCVLVGVLLF